jgi:hypothetical protein
MTTTANKRRVFYGVLQKKHQNNSFAITDFVGPNISSCRMFKKERRSEKGTSSAGKSNGSKKE